MDPNPLKDGTLNKTAIGASESSMLRKHAIEVARSHGRTTQDMSDADWEQARQDLSSSAQPDPKQAILEAAPESERWDPLPGSPGHKVAPTPSEDEDAEGRSDQSRLVEEGISAAEDDQSRQAEKQTPGEEK